MSGPQRGAALRFASAAPAAADDDVTEAPTSAADGLVRPGKKMQQTDKIADFTMSTPASPGTQEPKKDVVPRVAMQPKTGKIVKFDSAFHRYTVGGERQKSVTQLLKGKLKRDGEDVTAVTHPFNTEEISRKIAEMQGKSQQEVLAEWKAVATFGTNFHDYIHTALTGERMPNAPGWTEEEKNGAREKAYQSAFHEYHDVLTEYGYKMVEGGSEMIVASSKYSVAGTIDCLMHCAEGNEIEKRPHYLLVDWKTNTKPFRHQKPYRTEPQVLNWPFEDLPATKLSEYALQTNCYRHILLNDGYVPEDAVVLCCVAHFFQVSNGDVDLDAIAVDTLDTERVETLFQAAAPPEKILRKKRVPLS